MSETIFEPGSELAIASKIGEDLISDEITEEEAGARFAEQNLKGNFNLGNEGYTGSVVDAAEKAVEDVTGKDADEVYQSAKEEVNENNSNSNSSSSSSSSGNDNDNSQGLVVQPPTNNDPVRQKQPTMKAPIVDNPAQSNENIDMGITSTDSMSNGGGGNEDNSMMGAINTKIILGAVVIAALLMR